MPLIYQKIYFPCQQFSTADIYNASGNWNKNNDIKREGETYINGIMEMHW